MMALWWRASSGAVSRSIACIASVAWEETRLKKVPVTRASARPERSSASMVLAKLGGSGSVAMAAISARFPSIAARIAGAKCSGRMRSKGGRPKGVVQGSSSGFIWVF